MTSGTESTNASIAAAHADRVPFRSRRLEAVFGVPFNELRPEHIHALIAAQAEEDFDLDFKLTTYGNGDGAKRDLAGDVAALANTVGGALVIGIDEDEQGRAAAAPGVEVTDAEATRMAQVIAANTAPMPTSYVKKVVDVTSEAGPGFYVVVVPPSPMAPHAVLVNSGLRYPRRTGASIYYLSEPEVAAAYRARDLAAMQQSARADGIAAEAVARLHLKEPWLLLTLVPDVAGTAQINSTTFEDFRNAVLETEPFVARNSGMTYCRAQVGPRSFIADDAMQVSAPQAHRMRLQVFNDGAGTYALRLHDTTPHTPGVPELGETPRPIVVSDEWLAAGVLSGLHTLGQHAHRRAATSGGALVRLELVMPDDGQEVKLRWTRGEFAFADNHKAMTAQPGQPFVVTAPVELDAIANAGSDLVATAAAIGADVVQAFGLPEMPQFTAGGQIAMRYWANGYGGWRPGLTTWANDHGVTMC